MPDSDTPQPPDRAALRRFLARAQSAAILTPRQAAEIFDRWDGDVKSLPVDEAEHPLTFDAATAVAILLILWRMLRGERGKPNPATSAFALVPFNETTDVANVVRTMQTFLPTTTSEVLDQLHEETQDEFEANTARLGKYLVGGVFTLWLWHVSMRKAVQTHLLQQTMLGAGGTVPDPDRTQKLLTREAAYLQKFADEVAARRLLARKAAVAGKKAGAGAWPAFLPATAPAIEAAPAEGDGGFSAEYLANRAALYAGAARGEYYLHSEKPDRIKSRLAPQDVNEGPPRPFEGPFDDMYPIVFEYVTRGDGAVCGPCNAARGFYLPSEGPMPGAVCAGRSRCRCRRVLRADPAIYRQLVAERVAG